MAFTNVTSDFMKLAKIPERNKPQYIDFAATDYISLRDALIEYIKAVYPLDYNYFVESDLGMMFIELVAYMGTVMSMKADMLANENFLVTAKNRESVKKLLSLIGVRMRGPLSAAADAKITLESTPTDAALAINISPDNRVVNITSPEDGGPLTYTLYKVEGGLVTEAASDASLDLFVSETDNPLDGSTIYTNLVLQEGALVVDSGSFNSTESTKSIKLTQSPVIEGSVQVLIDSANSNVSGAYTEVPSLFFASSTQDKIFQVVYDNNYAASIIFGDNVNGISPDNATTYTVLYRVGGGSRGNIINNFINVNTTVVNNAANITAALTNISVATGGSNAETTEHAKKWAPLTFSRQDRVVTLEDYSVFANTFISTFGTVGKATAALRDAFCSANIIDIYVLERASDTQLQKATSEFKAQLLTAINPKKMATDEVVLVDGLIRTLDLIVTVRIDRELEKHEEVIKGKVRDIILKYMSVDNRDFGETLALADINRAIFELNEVRFSSIDNLDENVQIDFNEIIQLNNLIINIEYVE